MKWPKRFRHGSIPKSSAGLSSVIARKELVRMFYLRVLRLYLVPSLFPYEVLLR